MTWRRIDVHRAVEQGDIAVLTRYVESGGDLDSKDGEYGAAAVHWAALRGKLDALALLLDHGADLEARTNTDGTALVWGCMGGDARVVRHLLDRGADIASVTKGKGTALHHATHSGHPEVVAILLQEGADPRARDNRGERPGDSFDEEVTDEVRRVILRALGKARREGSPPPPRPSSHRRRGRADSHTHSRRGPASNGINGGHGNADSSNGLGRNSRSSHTIGASNGLGRNSRSSHTIGASNGHDHVHDRRQKGGQISERAENASPWLSHPGSASVRLVAAPSPSLPGAAAAAAVAALAHDPTRPARPASVSINRGPLEDAGDNSESVLAAEAALAAAAWSPKLLQEQNGRGPDTGSGTAAAAFSSGRGRGSICDAREQEQTRAVAAGDDIYGNPAEAGATWGSGGAAAAVAVTGGNGSRPERRAMSENYLLVKSLDHLQRETLAAANDAKLDGLLRETKDLTLAAETAAARDGEARNALRRAMAEADQRASEAVRAERARSDGMYALVQALEERLLERENRVRVLDAQLQDRNSRLQQAGHEVPIDESLAPMAVQKGVKGNEDGNLSGRGYSQSGSTPAAPDPLGGGGIYGMCGGDSRGREDSSGRDRAFGPGEEPRRSLSVTSIGQGGDGSRVGMLAWLRKDRQGSAPRKQSSQPLVEDQERIGRLYSMIARK